MLKNATGKRIWRGRTLLVDSEASSATCGVSLTPGDTVLVSPSRSTGGLGLSYDGTCLQSGLSISQFGGPLLVAPSKDQIAAIQAACI